MVSTWLAAVKPIEEATAWTKQGGGGLMSHITLVVHGSERASQEGVKRPYLGGQRLGLRKLGVFAIHGYKCN
jgi:hypothetical protein